MASDPCKQPEAMVKISNLVGLPIVYGALLEGPKLPLRAFLLTPSKKADITIVQGMERKISSSYPREGKGWVKHPEHFRGGAVQIERQTLGSAF